MNQSQSCSRIHAAGRGAERASWIGANGEATNLEVVRTSAAAP